jgi:hypothetical protein
MKKMTIIFIELGMLAGIVVAGYMLPDATPLRTFLIASGTCFVLGNVLLYGKLPQERAEPQSWSRKPWTHFYRAALILAVCWLLILLLYRK